MDKIISSFPSISVNNSRSIVKNLIELCIQKPSYNLMKKLEAMGIGFDMSHEYDDVSRVENVCLLNEAESITNEEIANLI